MEVYNNPLKFQTDCIIVHITRYGIFKIMVFSYILYCGGQGVPTTIQNVWETICMILKMPYLLIRICNLFEILKDDCRPPYLAIDAIIIRLLGATNVLMHEAIRIMNMCHYCI